RGFREDNPVAESLAPVDRTSHHHESAGKPLEVRGDHGDRAAPHGERGVHRLPAGDRQDSVSPVIRKDLGAVSDPSHIRERRVDHRTLEETSAMDEEKVLDVEGLSGDRVLWWYGQELGGTAGH